jgi:hypothetical protein
MISFQSIEEIYKVSSNYAMVSLSVRTKFVGFKIKKKLFPVKKVEFLIYIPIKKKVLED